MADDDTPLMIVQLDDGEVNTRILQRQVQADFRRVESASLKLHVRLYSAAGKRLFVRSFHSFQLLNHFMSMIARITLGDERIQRVEQAMRESVDRVSQALDEALDHADQLFKAHGVTQMASVDTVPLDVQVPVLSSLSRRYLEAIGKLDQLMSVLDTLEIYEIWSPSDIDQQRALFKRELRAVVHETRGLATEVRRELDRAKEAAQRAAAQEDPDRDLVELLPVAAPVAVESARSPELASPEPETREAEQA